MYVRLCLFSCLSSAKIHTLRKHMASWLKHLVMSVRGRCCDWQYLVLSGPGRCCDWQYLVLSVPGRCCD